MNADLDPLAAEERKWRLRATKAEVWRTVAISIIGAAVAGVFYLYQDSQTRSRYFAEFQAQRESADTNLRAQMFNTLFQNYFKTRLESSERALLAKATQQVLSDAQLDDMRQEIVLSDLLARNFESVDVRPLFEDIDRRLSGRIAIEGREGQEALPDQRKAFALREQLRRVARGATTRQTESLIARAQATSSEFTVQKCDSPQSPATITPAFLPGLPGGASGLVEDVSAAGVVSVSLIMPTGSTVKNGEAPPPRRVPLNVSFYDMPALENVRVPSGERVSITLTRFLSASSCERFWNQVDESTMVDCGPLLEKSNDASNPQSCSRADLSVIVLPRNYIGVRDRPYLTELSGAEPPWAAPKPR
jgi:hypothetical protein